MKPLRKNNKIAGSVRALGSHYRHWKKFDMVRCQCKNEGIPLPNKKDHEAQHPILVRFAASLGIKSKDVIASAKRKSRKTRNKSYTDKKVFTAWRLVRYEALKRSNGNCECCGATATSTGEPLHVDHIKPKSLYPELSLELSNLQVLCADCNVGKGNWDETNWRERREETQATEELDIHCAFEARTLQ